MELSQQQEEFKKDLATAIAKAWEDVSFKKELVASPKEAIESVTGRKLHLKEEINFVVTDQSNTDTFYFNLPSKPDLRNMELTEEQLELVAGGGDELTNGEVAVIVAGAAVGVAVGVFHGLTGGIFR